MIRALSDGRRRVLVLLAALPLLGACGRPAPRLAAIPGGATVLALGDSLTAGVGAPPGENWPTLLAAASGWQLINAGVSGDTAPQALERLPALLAAHRPALVIVSIGGNDLLRRTESARIRATIADICRRAQASGAQVVLVSVPQPTLLSAAAGRLRDHPLYAELAAELQLPLYAGGWSEVLSDSALRADTIHANAAGYARFTAGLTAFLRERGLLQP